jgi:uncharacterized lipoprotein YajG
MNITSTLRLALALLFVGAVPAAAQQQTPPPPATQDKPADAKAASSIAGKWDMTAETPQGATPVTLVMKLDGKKVTGTLTGPQGEIPLEGEFADGKLTMTITIQGGAGEMSVTFNGTLKEDGTLAGTFDFGQGAMNWKATRAKDKN